MKKALIGLVAVVVLGIAGAGWYYAGQALMPGGARAPEFELVVRGAVSDGQIVLSDDPDARLEVVGLLYAGGYGRLSGPVEDVDCPNGGADAACVRRDFALVTGVTPAVGTAVKADEYAFAPGNPTLALGVEVQTLDIDIPGGTAPAWWIAPRDSDVVAVLVHGRGGSRDEMLRMASVLLPLGHGVLIPSYRGDGTAPDPEDGIGRFGADEWLDVAVAMMDPVIPSGARFVMVGNSQGGALVAHLLAKGDLADRVDAVVLDSPLIGLDATMVLQARLAGIPNPLVRPVLESAYVFARTKDFNFASGEHVAFLAQQPRPILLFHGDGDTFVAVGPSERLAAEDPAGVTYVRVPGVDHVRFWNNDPQAYAEAVTSFLDEHL